MLAGGNTISGSGSIAANVALASGVLSASGGSLNVLGVVSGYGVVIGSVNANAISSPSGTVNIPGGLNIGNRTATIYSLAGAHLGGATTITAGGSIVSANGLVLNSGDQISGTGTA